MELTIKEILADGDVSKKRKDFFDPFNPNNKEITLKQINVILQKNNYT